jgi:(1->4)-alpha-D-glucan 1-alpha-D-glucosylmutase
VGGEPDWTGDGAIEFHSFNQERLRKFPLGLNTTSTHDTKRSEDVRARIHVISELSEEWTTLFEKWRGIGGEVPNAHTKYLVYETLAGTWPLDGQLSEDFRSRMEAYFIKAAREAKSETSWTEPDPAYEKALGAFVDGLLTTSNPQMVEWRKSFQSFAEKCAYFGAFNSLSTVALKAFSPGIPDFYQGCELWDSSLVDPDNRRPVDYDLRMKCLNEMKAGLKKDPRAYLDRIVGNWKTGEVKLWLTREMLRLRATMPSVFRAGEYLSLEAQGEAKGHFIGLVRHYKSKWLMLVVPRKLARFEKPGKNLTLRSPEMLAAEFTLPPSAPITWKHALTGARLAGSTFRAEDLFQGLPVSVLAAEI